MRFFLALVVAMSVAALPAPLAAPPNATQVVVPETLHQVGTARIALGTHAARGVCIDAGFDKHPPHELPKKATADDLVWQPALDFDTDSCYNVPAIGPDGHVDRGRSRHETNTEGCRTEYDLNHSNVYSRRRCNNGWCGYVYDYFFEKDIGDSLCIGHQYDWEHIVVWTKDGVPRMAAVSAHGRYHARLWEDIPKEGTHVKAVYNKDGKIGTHYFRWSMGPGDEPPENHKHVWWRTENLISWEGYPTLALRERLAAYDFGDAQMAIRDDTLAWNLERSVRRIREQVPDFKFDFDNDGSPGAPRWTDVDV
ncbi:FG-GAP repeat domain containing protein [Tolypocladium paradoxum]|uniref:FG-GAP repeat domain containing protein n=1 Tax=Tolypocladium paradoxum TaxID=94208 RepID=A0A2S4L775_9HYPO|nr:FG-GAP repeat domain containing protein [Tolypocladium paradoxum]